MKIIGKLSCDMIRQLYYALTAYYLIASEEWVTDGNIVIVIIIQKLCTTYHLLKQVCCFLLTSLITLKYVLTRVIMSLIVKCFFHTPKQKFLLITPKVFICNVVPVLSFQYLRINNRKSFFKLWNQLMSLVSLLFLGIYLYLNID